MQRINVHAKPGPGPMDPPPRFLFWFDLDGITDRVNEGADTDGQGNRIGHMTGRGYANETLYRTKKGLWVRHHNEPVGPDQWTHLDDEAAHQWLQDNNTPESHAVAERYFGPQAEELQFNVGGRPAIGPSVSAAYPQDLLDRIDDAARAAGVTRAQMLRTIAAERFPAPVQETVDA